MKNILTCFLLRNSSRNIFSILFYFSKFSSLNQKSSNKNRFTVTRAPQKHVRPTHLSDDKYLIKFSFSPLFPFQHFLPVLKSKSLEQQASAYLFSFNTQTHGHRLGVCVCTAVSRWEQNKNETKRNFSVARGRKNFFVLLVFSSMPKAKVLHPFSIVWWFVINESETKDIWCARILFVINKSSRWAFSGAFGDSIDNLWMKSLL